MGPQGVMFHHFHDRVHPVGQGSISGAELERLIESIGRHRILPACEYLWRAQRGKLRAGDLCLTFDDNLRCQFDIARPVLDQFGLTAFWFVYTSVLQGNVEPLEIYRYFRNTQFDSVDGFYDAFFDVLDSSPHAQIAEMLLEEFNPRTYLAGFPFYTDADRKFRFVRDEALGPARYCELMDQMIAEAGIDISEVAKQLWMRDDDIRALHGAGHVIGLHSHTHPTRMEHLDEDGQRDQYFENYSYLNQLLDERPAAMSHPCNSYNATTLAILRELGITLGFRANMAAGYGGELEHPREDHANLMRAMAA
ncbi:MAG TPA: polysaccharide deacetylase family protein [Tepidisphaeraceae bacterium]|jgi:peptidoglycan/xylan/chitin deacetylase (PgdA/CDA1 family)|nr:polysaccharide deacetylase family protein [Tepidisphaeraceae bacterium]